MAIDCHGKDSQERLIQKEEEVRKREALQSELERVSKGEEQQRKRAEQAEELRALASARRKEEATACEEHRIKLKHMEEELQLASAAAQATASSKVAASLESQEETAALRARAVVADNICKWWIQKQQVLEKEYSNYMWLHQEIEKEYL